jgi:hypothetical protein
LVHGKLGFACVLAFRQRRIVEKRKADGALDLVGALARKKDRSRMRIDAPYRRAAMRCGIGEQRECLGLRSVLSGCRKQVARIGFGPIRCRLLAPARTAGRMRPKAE